MEHAYAQALWKLLASGKKPKEAVQALHATLAAHGRAALLPRIGRAFTRIAAREQAARGLTLTIASGKDERTAKHEAKQALAEMGRDADEIVVLIDDSLIGGWRLEGSGVLLDRSFKKQLLSLYNRSTA